MEISDQKAITLSWVWPRDIKILMIEGEMCPDQADLPVGRLESENQFSPRPVDSLALTLSSRVVVDGLRTQVLAKERDSEGSIMP